MSLEAQDKQALSDIRMAKAQQFLDDSKANYKDGRYKTSVNRSYYAVLNAARAILILEGADPGTHEGTITMLNLRFVKGQTLTIATLKLENRSILIGTIDRKLWTTVFTRRSDSIRIISVRRARKKEAELYGKKENS